MMLKICQSFLCYTQQMCSQTFVNQQQYSSSLCYSYCVVPEKNRYPPHGRSLEIPRGKGVLKAKIVQAKYEAKLESLGGGGGAQQKNLLWGEKRYFLILHIIHVMSIQSIGRDVGHHPYMCR